MILAIAVASAQDHSSEPVDLLFEDTFELLAFSSVDTGYIPSQNDPVSVRFHITPSGGIVTAFEAVSTLEWPTAFKHTLTPVPGEGVFGIDTVVDIEFEAHINVAGIFQDSIPVWDEQFSLTAGTLFDTFVLPNSPEAPVEVAVSDPGLIPAFDYDFDIIAGVVGLDLAVEFVPALSASLAGDRIETLLSGATSVIDEEGAFAQLDPPTGNPAELLLVSRYFAELATSFDLIIRPSATLDTIVGDFELVQFDFPVELLSNTQEREFDPVTYIHRLPGLEPFDLLTDFGLVEVGDERTLEIPLRSIGALDIEGTLHVEGEGDFTVWPEYFYATPGQTDGAVVVFAPTEDAEMLATLVIESNDPVAPEIRIPLTGHGFVPSPYPDLPRGEGVSEPAPADEGAQIRTCGCDSRAQGSVGLAVLLGVFGLRRRHQ